ncbi:MAG: hypothetical protein AAF497_15760 [Planctomycetota bacterium]
MRHDDATDWQDCGRMPQSRVLLQTVDNALGTRGLVYYASA